MSLILCYALKFLFGPFPACKQRSCRPASSASAPALSSRETFSLVDESSFRKPGQWSKYMITAFENENCRKRKIAW